MQLAARFVVPVRAARVAKDELARRILERFDDAGIEVASTTSDVRVTLRGSAPAADPDVAQPNLRR